MTRDLPKNIKNSHEKLLNRSWYVIPGEENLDFFSINNLSDLEVDELMQEYAYKIKDDTLKSLESSFPDIYRISKDAFKAHEEGLYSLSIPTLLAQADGICYKLLKFSLYSKKNINQRTREALKASQDSSEEIGEKNLLYIAYFTPLELITTLNKSTHQLEEGHSINRHAVLHGLDQNYDTERNSLRCIVLIDYVLKIRNQLISI